MNNKAAFYSVILLALGVSQAGAGETFSPAYVPQIEAVSFSRVSTADIMKPAMEVARALPALRPDNGNLALVWQDGVNNNASIIQNGSGNVGLIRQIGMDNIASIRQSGSGHQAFIAQRGRGNRAFIAQR